MIFKARLSLRSGFVGHREGLCLVPPWVGPRLAPPKSSRTFSMWNSVVPLEACTSGSLRPLGNMPRPWRIFLPRVVFGVDFKVIYHFLSVNWYGICETQMLVDRPGKKCVEITHGGYADIFWAAFYCPIRVSGVCVCFLPV